MGANIKFAWNNLMTAAGVALTASSSVTGMPVDAILNTDRNYVWQSSTGVGAPTIDIDLGAVRELTCAMLANVRVLAGGAVQLYQRGDGGAPGAAVLVATFPAADLERRTSFVFFASQSHRHWQLKFTNPGAVNSYAELGFAFLGAYDEPTVNVRVPIPTSSVDPSVMSQSSDGQKGFAARTPYEAGVWVFDAVQEAQRAQVKTMFRSIGVSTPMFVVLDQALAWTCWLARIVTGVPIEVEPAMALGRYGVQVPWEEVR
jgi:hypothetical protein